MRSVAGITELLGRAGSYAALRFAVDTSDPPRGALLAQVEERATAISNELLFVELEWAALPDDAVEVLFAAPELDFCRHYLRAVRRYRPHLRSEPEERILADKAVTGSSAWARLFSEVTSAITVELDTGPVSLEQALSTLQSPDRDIRRTAAEAVSEALQPGLRTRAFIFNTLLADKSTDDRIRHYDGWLASRNLDNEASDESVQALVAAVVHRADIPQRWYTLKAQLLGVDRIADYDRMASIASRRHRVRMGRSAGTRPRRLRLVLARARRRGPPVLRRVLDRRPGPPRETAGRLLRLHRPVAAPLRAPQLDVATARRADPRPRARPRLARLPRPGSGGLPPVDAADPGRDRVGVRRDGHVRAAARRDHRPRRPPRAPRREPRGPDRHRVPPDRDEPVRGPGPHRTA